MGAEIANPLPPQFIQESGDPGEIFIPEGDRSGVEDLAIPVVVGQDV